VASTQSRYDHAAELQRSQPPVIKMGFLVDELKAWAAANPSLKVLHSEFAALLREMREAQEAERQADQPVEHDEGDGHDAGS
jgi:hypothetical protein